MASVQRLSRALSGASLALVTAGGLTVVTALASGYGQGNFDAGGNSVNQIGVANGSLTGYNPAPAAYDTSANAVNVGYSFTVSRYTGANHVPPADAIDVALNLRVLHVVSIAGSGDSDADVASGDPNASGSNPPFSEAYLLAHAAALGEVPVSSVPFGVHLDPHGQTQDFTFTVSIPSCGYYEIDSGATDSKAGHLNDFSALTAGYVRATGCGGGSGSPSPTATPTASSTASPTATPTASPTATPAVTPASGVQGITTTAEPSPTAAVAGAVQAVSTPDTGVASDVNGTLMVGLLLMGAGLITGGVGNRTRRHLVQL